MFNLQHPELSKNYQLLTLDRIDEYARTIGYERTSLQSKRKRMGKESFGAYLAKYRPIGHTLPYDGIELVVLNSNDGSKALRVFYGYFRGVCSNGMILGTSIVSCGRMVHIGTGFHSHLDLAFNEILLHASKGVDFKNRLENIPISEASRNEVFKRVVNIRDRDFNPAKDLLSALVPKRDADMPLNLWTAFNMVQEALIMGGYTINDSKKKKAITSPEEILRINTQLSELFATVQ